MMVQQCGQSQVICNGVCAPCPSSVLTLCFSVCSLQVSVVALAITVPLGNLNFSELLVNYQ
jgi:hypothetical protein